MNEQFKEFKKLVEKAKPVITFDKLSDKQIVTDLFNIVSNGKYDMNKLEKYFNRIDQALTDLDRLRHVPTADEVCEALSEYLGIRIVYDKSKKSFYDGNMRDCKFIYTDNYDDLIIDCNVPPHLINLVSRFYMGVQNE